MSGGGRPDQEHESTKQAFALKTIESEDDEEVNAIETMQEVVEVTVDSGAAKSFWPSLKNIKRTKSTRTVKLTTPSRSPI